MRKREKDYILYYLDQLSLKLKNNISEMQQGLSHIAEKPPECLIRIKEVCLLVGISRSTLYKMIEEGSFPKPLDLGSRFKAWQKQTVINWIATLNSHE
jgi:prophage regulatory protein